MNTGPARVLWSRSPIRSRQDFTHFIQLAHITDESSQALSVVRELRLGRVFVAPLDIVIRRDPLRTRQADLMFISNARHNVIGLQVIEGGPDLVIAMLSPTNTRLELREKLQAYQTIGVREAWSVSPQAQTVEVLQLSAEGIQRLGLYGLGHLIVSQVLPKMQPAADELFPAL
jgi:Uma2 family endonuclease